MRLIDADALKKSIDALELPNTMVPMALLEALMNSLSTVNAVPVVRCKDCKHFKSVLCPLSMADGYYWPAHNPDFFCADGERKEE